MKEILKEYQDRCPEKDNFDLQVYELGMILKEVFPDVERVHRTLLKRPGRIEQAQMTSYLPQISRETSFPSPGVAVHIRRKPCVEGLHFVRKNEPFT